MEREELIKAIRKEYNELKKIVVANSSCGRKLPSVLKENGFSISNHNDYFYYVSGNVGVVIAYYINNGWDVYGNWRLSKDINIIYKDTRFYGSQSTHFNINNLENFKFDFLTQW